MATSSGERTSVASSVVIRSTPALRSPRQTQGSASTVNLDWRSMQSNGVMPESTAVLT